ncbi:hypothetical protein ACFE04_008745 [Oxalis oulophora]
MNTLLSIPSSSFTVKPCHATSYYKNTPQLSFTRKRPRFSRRRRQDLSKSNPNMITNNPIILSPSSDNQNLNFVLDINQLQNLVVSRYNSFIYSGEEALNDLQTLVTFDDNRRVYFSCRKSTLYFVGNVALWGFVVVVAFRVLLGIVSWLGSGLRNVIRGGVQKPRYVVRRDRSLGGKEVVVAVDQDGNVMERSGKKKRGLDNPLSLSEQDYASGVRKWKRSSSAATPKLPNWWPVSVAKNVDLLVDPVEYQKEADRLIRVVIDQRTSGKDMMDDDIIQLRRTCRTSGVRVSIETANTRDAIYRTVVDFVLNFCSRLPTNSTYVEIDGEDCRQFLAGFAENIGLENFRAARMISGAVAARTRSRFLQAWALELQGKHSEAIWELSRICLVLRIFPPEESSAEMEMVARGLSNHLKLEQRELLMEMIDEDLFILSQEAMAK